ncbi:MAG: hypothetical protein GX660_16960 [Clostridiaceae bacterium]|nr:hypothetical protein [Clostridiaceae bacterium]
MILILGILQVVHAELTYLPITGNSTGIWDSDSLFLGGEIAVKDSTKEVVVTWKLNKGDALGMLYFVKNKDSSIFLFHNKIEDFHEEKKEVRIGKFPKGTKLYFMYMVTDTSSFYKDKVKKRLYSGQNRIQDLYISDRKGLKDFRWAVAGTVDTNTCEISFASTVKANFRQIRFHISNSYLIR